MKIAVTGAAGFLGSELAKYFKKQGAELILIDNMEYGYEDNLSDYPGLLDSLIVDDIRNDSVIQRLLDVEVVFHFAGISSLPECESNPVKAIDVNTTSVARILSGLRKSQKLRRFIFASTSAVYENNADSIMTEDMPVAPNLIYATTKLCAEHICRSYAQNYGMDIAVCRFFNVFGPHQDYLRPQPPFTSYLIREISAGRRPLVYNTSDVKRDYIYADDLIFFLEAVMRHSGKMCAEIYNLCSGQGYSALEILETIYKTMGKEPVFDRGDPGKYWDKYPVLFSGVHNLSNKRIEKEVFKDCIGSNAKISALTGLRCTVDLVEGLRHIANYQTGGTGGL